MKYLNFIYLFLFLWGCSKEKPNVTVPDVCIQESIKIYEGVYEMWEYWPIFDSLNNVKFKYDTVSSLFHLKYQDCGKIEVIETKAVFSFDSSSTAVAHLSTNPSIRDDHQLTIINTDSIRYYQVTGRSLMIYHSYAGRRK